MKRAFFRKLTPEGWDLIRAQAEIQLHAMSVKEIAAATGLSTTGVWLILDKMRDDLRAGHAVSRETIKFSVRAG